MSGAGKRRSGFRNGVLFSVLAAGETFTSSTFQSNIADTQKFHDAASLCSLAPDADGVSDSHVRVQLPLDRRANKFDRGFPSVDDTASYARAYQTVMTADKQRRSQSVETRWRCFILPYLFSVLSLTASLISLHEAW